MRWSGVGLQQSLWVKQSNISRQEDYIKRTLYFEPWLDLHAGEYTCSLVIRNVDNCYFMMNKTIEIKGTCMYAHMHIC